jgi:hypothetical protein
MSGLNKLNISNNRLMDMPNEIGALTRLTQFDYAGNNFSYEVQQKIMNIMAGGFQPVVEPSPKGKKQIFRKKKAVQKRKILAKKKAIFKKKVVAKKTLKLN